MRKKPGIKLAMVLLACFCILPFPAGAAADGTDREQEDAEIDGQVYLPKCRVCRPDPDKYFLLAFDISGSMWQGENGLLTEDFKAVYDYFSAQTWAVEHEALLFHETDVLASDKLAEYWKERRMAAENGKTCPDRRNLWRTTKNTDLKNAFSRTANYFSNLEDKTWVYFVMVSDFYDTYVKKDFEAGEAFNQNTPGQETASQQNGEPPSREIYYNYFIFDALSEKENGYIQHAVQEEKGEKFEVKRLKRDSLEDPYLEVKKLFIREILKGLTGDISLDWQRAGETLKQEEETGRAIPEYYVYSDRKIEKIPIKYQENCSEICAFQTGGFLYYIHQVSLKDIEITRNASEIYILPMPYLKFEFTPVMTNGGENRAGKKEITLKPIDSKCSFMPDSFCMLFEEKERGEAEILELVRDYDDYSEVINLLPGTYDVRLRCMEQGRELDFLLSKDWPLSK